MTGPCKTLRRAFLSYLFVIDKWCAAAIMESRESPFDYAVLIMLSEHFLSYALSFGTSHANVLRLEAENNCV